jgi:DNA-binding XRE family transcriptional regulator
VPVAKQSSARTKRAPAGPRQEERRKLVNQLGVPFARALAAFIQSLEEGEGTLADFPRASSRFPAVFAAGGGAGAGAGAGEADPASGIVGDLDPAMVRRVRQAIAENDALERRGEAEVVEFTADSPAEAAARRLKALAKRQGVSQSELAQRLGVTPAVVSRVFKNPDRSKVQTIRRIAKALGVSVREVI